MEEKVKLIYDETPDQVADNIFATVKNVAPFIEVERLDGGDGFEEYLVKCDVWKFMTFLENNYYYTSGVWVDCITEVVTQREDIYKAYLAA